MNAGGEKWFVPGGLLPFWPRNTKSDYHATMNNECFKTWCEDQLLPNIPSRSLITMDNATYHSQVINKAPTNNCTKYNIIQ